MRTKKRSARIGRHLGYVKQYSYTNVPNGTLMKVRYVLPSLKISVASGVIGAYNFSGNSIYDPDNTGTGSTAYQMSQMATDYTAYRVLGSKIKVRAQSFGSGSGAEGYQNTAWLFPSPDRNGSGPYTSWTDGQLNVYPYTKERYFNVDDPSRNANRNQWSFKHYASSKKMIRAYNQQDASGLCGGLGTGSSPSQQWWWQIVIANKCAASFDSYLRVEIVYYTLFFEKKQIAGGEL